MTAHTTRVQSDSYKWLFDEISADLGLSLVQVGWSYRWSSYKVYAYGRKTPKWLSTDLIFSQFVGDQDCHRSYREKNFLSRAERILKCDIEHFAQSRRLSGAEKDIRDVLLYCIWATGQLKNEQIGKLFGLSYSGVSHAVKSIKSKITKDRQLRTKFDQLNSLFKL